MRVRKFGVKRSQDNSFSAQISITLFLVEPYTALVFVSVVSIIIRIKIYVSI